MNTKHTQGKWMYRNIGGAIEVRGQQPSETEYRLLICTMADHADPQAEANARLIAAAPELLAACQELMGLAEREGWQHVAINNARAALAKANG